MKTAVFLVVIMLSYNAYANKFIQKASCFVPNKPLMFSPNSYIEQYNKDVVEYKKCIYRFISEQESEIVLHRESIEQARKLLEKNIN